MADNAEYEVFKLGDWDLQSGEKIEAAHIAYKTFGDPKNPAIVYPTWFSGCEHSGPADRLIKVLIDTLRLKLSPIISG